MTNKIVVMLTNLKHAYSNQIIQLNVFDLKFFRIAKRDSKQISLQKYKH